MQHPELAGRIDAVEVDAGRHRGVDDAAPWTTVELGIALTWSVKPNEVYSAFWSSENITIVEPVRW